MSHVHNDKRAWRDQRAILAWAATATRAVVRKSAARMVTGRACVGRGGKFFSRYDTYNGVV